MFEFVVAPIGLALDPTSGGGGMPMTGVTREGSLALIPLHLLPAAVIIVAFARQQRRATR